MSNQTQNDSLSPARSPEECDVSGARLVAGRELDALVAEKVMGWKYCGIHPIHRCRVFATGHSDTFAPNFSTDIAAAWQVVERVRKIIPKQTSTQTFSFSLNQSGIPGGWHCSFTVNDGDWSTQAYVDEVATAPLAICLAALKAVQSPANGEASNTGAQGVQTNGPDSGVQSEGGRAEERA